eukprot:CAMPEP_0202098486 /NCGR_PEP_ID=MMETSP0965-20130614/1859_1 /ASSEMBLY_ACC=CAM_ASM_000507 /TAXON_ID=4773 /ORGANISM="Schizochytrium aggregatum, Strain ATCC28209" /LENGTH=109 /DNA_ID=CAMNT_0048666949 /DNA_START=214 /DNA_END=540 /DNA_ORIENTATION=+
MAELALPWKAVRVAKDLDALVLGRVDDAAAAKHLVRELRLGAGLELVKRGRGNVQVVRRVAVAAHEVAHLLAAAHLDEDVLLARVLGDGAGGQRLRGRAGCRRFRRGRR